MSKEKQRIYTGIESEGVRGKEAVEQMFNEGMSLGYDTENLPQLNVDQLLVDLCDKAVKDNKNKIRVLDFGSGKNGTFICSFAERKDFPLLHTFLENHPKFQVEVIGFTSTNSHKQGEIIKHSNLTVSTPDQISVTNYSYTVTRNQTVKKFLDQSLNHHNQQFELIFATWSLGYLTPTNFAQALEDLINSLEAGGRLYCTEYHAVDPGIERRIYRIKKLIIDPDNDFSVLNHPEMIDTLESNLKKTTVIKILKLILKVDPQLEIIIKRILIDNLDYQHDYKSQNIFKQVLQNLQLRRIKNKLIKTDLLEGNLSTLPLEIFSNTFLWQFVVNSCNFLLVQEIRKKTKDYERKRKMVEDIGQLEDIQVQMSDHAFVIDKKNTQNVTKLVQKIRSLT